MEEKGGEERVCVLREMGGNEGRITMFIYFT